MWFIIKFKLHGPHSLKATCGVLGNRVWTLRLIYPNSLKANTTEREFKLKPHSLMTARATLRTTNTRLIEGCDSSLTFKLHGPYSLIATCVVLGSQFWTLRLDKSKLSESEYYRARDQTWLGHIPWWQQGYSPYLHHWTHRGGIWFIIKFKLHGPYSLIATYVVLRSQFWTLRFHKSKLSESQYYRAWGQTWLSHIPWWQRGLLSVPPTLDSSKDVIHHLVFRRHGLHSLIATCVVLGKPILNP